MASDLVRVAIEGACVVKPTMRHSKRGNAILKFGLLSTPRYTIRENLKRVPMYFTVTANGKIAETTFPMIKCGVPMRVEGNYNDGLYRDKITDETKIGRVVYADIIRIFVYWEYRTAAMRQRQEEEALKEMVVPKIEDLPF